MSPAVVGGVRDPEEADGQRRIGPDQSGEFVDRPGLVVELRDDLARDAREGDQLDHIFEHLPERAVRLGRRSGSERIPGLDAALTGDSCGGDQSSGFIVLRIERQDHPCALVDHRPVGCAQRNQRRVEQ